MASVGDTSAHILKRGKSIGWDKEGRDEQGSENIVISSRFLIQARKEEKKDLDRIKQAIK